MQIIHSTDHLTSQTDLESEISAGRAFGRIYLDERSALMYNLVQIEQLLQKKNVSQQKGRIMETKKYIYWQEDDMWIGYLEEYPDYMTQGETIEQLKENLRDIYCELTSGTIPSVRKVAVLEIS